MNSSTRFYPYPPSIAFLRCLHVFLSAVMLCAFCSQLCHGGARPPVIPVIPDLSQVSCLTSKQPTLFWQSKRINRCINLCINLCQQQNRLKLISLWDNRSIHRAIKHTSVYVLYPSIYISSLILYVLSSLWAFLFLSACISLLCFFGTLVHVRLGLTVAYLMQTPGVSHPHLPAVFNRIRRKVQHIVAPRGCTAMLGLWVLRCAQSS